MADSKLKKAVYIGGRPVNPTSPTLQQGIDNAKSELGKAFEWVTGSNKKKKKPEEV